MQQTLRSSKGLDTSRRFAALGHEEEKRSHDIDGKGFT